MPVVPVFWRCGSEDQKFKVILSYVASERPPELHEITFQRERNKKLWETVNYHNSKFKGEKTDLKLV